MTMAKRTTLSRALKFPCRERWGRQPMRDRVRPFTMQKIAFIEKKDLILTLREVVTFRRAPVPAGGTVSSDQAVLELARRWTGLINEFTGGDQGIERSVGRLWKEQGDNLIARRGTEYDSRDVYEYEYIGQAIAVVKGSG